MTPASWRPSWRDRTDGVAAAPAVPGAADTPFYLAIGEHQGETYRRNAFARGTEEEVAALGELVDLSPGTRLLDVGCGDARHLRLLAGRGVVGTGVDVSPALIAAGRSAAEQAGVEVELLVGDARHLARVLPRDGYDVAWSLCQGALGTSPVSDPAVLAGMATALRPGGRLVATFFHALFAARHLAPGDAFDTVNLVHHQLSEVHGRDGARAHHDLWTASYTVREALALVTAAGLEPVAVRGVEPGAYGRRDTGEVGLDDPELLVVAVKPDGGAAG